jgi:hypothetical protein
MRKFIGFGLLLALIVAPMATALGASCNLYPVVPSSVGPYSAILAVTNLTETSWNVDDDTELVITTRAPGLTDKTSNFDLEAGETLLALPSDFQCGSGAICTVYITGGAGSFATALPPGLTSTLFLTNGGSVIAVISPIVYDSDGNCTAVGAPLAPPAG